jgi:hypothetical protein
MPHTSTDDTSFPIARCNRCRAFVLIYVALDPDGAERRCCTRCDSALDSKPEWISAEELESLGYYMGERPPPAGGECASCATGGGCSKK